MSLLLRSFFLFVFLFSSFSYATDVLLEVHAVGQGNCVTVRFQKDLKSEPEFMVVDAGTSSFKKEHTYIEAKKEEPPKEPSESKKPSDYKKITEKIGAATKKDEDNYISKLRTKLAEGNEDESDSLRLKTVVITHPDADHYNWIHKIFNNEKDQIEYIILGGLPEAYPLENKDSKFTGWLVERLNHKSTVHFPEIEHDPIRSPEELDKILNLSKEGHYAQDEYSIGKPLERFREALDFGEGVSIDILSTCPTHTLPKEKGIRKKRTNTNDDSLVLKITNNKNSSALLTGDATGVTLDKILKNYEEHSEFLEADVFLICHHGAKTRGSNKSSFIDKIKFKHAFISAGHTEKYAHPQKEMIKNIKKAEKLEKTKKAHEVLTFKEKKKGSQKAEEEIEVTQAAYYSTLSSGNLRASLPPKGPVKIETDREEEIVTPPSSPQDSEEDDPEVKDSQSNKRKHKDSESQETQSSKDKEEEETLQSKKQKENQEKAKKSSPSKAKSRSIGKKRIEKKRKVTVAEETKTASKKYNLRQRPKKEETKKTPTRIKKRKTEPKKTEAKSKA